MVSSPVLIGIAVFFLILSLVMFMPVCTVRERADVRYERLLAAYDALHEEKRIPGHRPTAAEFAADARPSRTVH